jgi:hypothetical protein
MCYQKEIEFILEENASWHLYPQPNHAIGVKIELQGKNWVYKAVKVEDYLGKYPDDIVIQTINYQCGRGVGLTYRDPKKNQKLSFDFLSALNPLFKQNKVIVFNNTYYLLFNIN